MLPSSFLQIDDSRVDTILEDVAVGSEPAARFYILVVLSAMIASFGLVANSTAVVIGAMLVAPLMTPIFGISLGLIRGDASLFRNALVSEVLGVLASITMACLLGFLILIANPYPETTPEMLARTKPNLFDLVVAVLAGIAGTYALIDEKISPALPGVAIATAIVPPLANTGLCIAYGAYYGALGSFLLFFANFISILLVAAILFARAGMNRGSGLLNKSNIIRKFGFAVVCFMLMTVFLGNTLNKMVAERNLYNRVRNALNSEFSEYPATEISGLLINKLNGTAYVLAEILSPNQVTPNQVQTIETELIEKTNTPINLIIRTIKSSDTSSTGSNSTVIAQDLDGFYVSLDVDPKVEIIRLSEQALREYLDDQIGLDLVELDYLEFTQGKTILALMMGFRQVSEADIGKMEQLLRERTGNKALNLIVRFIKIDILDKEGSFHYGWFDTINAGEKQLEMKKNLSAHIKQHFASDPEFVVENINAAITENGYDFLIELSGSSTLTPDDVFEFQEDLKVISDRPVRIYAWINQGAVVTERGLESFEILIENKENAYGEAYKHKIKDILKSLR